MEKKYYDRSLYENFYNEWLLTNQLGGFAQSFGNGINERKYNGLLIAATKNNIYNHIVSSIEEKFESNSSHFYTDSTNYIDTIYPDGYRHLLKSYMRPFPAYIYSSNPYNGDILLIKTIKMHPNKNITLVRYHNISEIQFHVCLRPKLTCHYYHYLNKPGTFSDIAFDIKLLTLRNTKTSQQPFKGGSFSRQDNGINAYIYTLTNGSFDDLKFSINTVQYHNIFYPRDAERGYDAVEDQIAPFAIEHKLNKGEYIDILFSDNLINDSIADTVEKINNRYNSLPLAKDHPLKKYNPSSPTYSIFKAIKIEDEQLYTYKEYRKILKDALLDFKVGNDIKAGYPWFGSWGRDSMIILEAFQSKYKTIKNGDSFIYSVLQKYGKLIKNGIIPNTINEGNIPAYNTIDASLLLIMRAFDVFPNISQTRQLTLFKYCSQIVLNYLLNTDLPFYCDLNDYLLEIKNNIGLALTWMDAIVNGMPVTPRYGKPIEINALWYNSLCCLQEFCKVLEVKTIKSNSFSITTSKLSSIIKTVKKSMNNFIINNQIADRIENNLPVMELRPNAIFAFSLPFQIYDESIQKQYELDIKEELLTPYGLRSLTQKEPAFRKRFIGTQKQRDLAYHQGTVWAWLLLPYAHMLSKSIQNKAKLKQELESIILKLRKGFMNNHKASVAEVWDGAIPHIAKGCPAQGWSVAALYIIENSIEESI